MIGVLFFQEPGQTPEARESQKEELAAMVLTQVVSTVYITVECCQPEPLTPLCFTG